MDNIHKEEEKNPETYKFKCKTNSVLIETFHLYLLLVHAPSSLVEGRRFDLRWQLIPKSLPETNASLDTP